MKRHVRVAISLDALGRQFAVVGFGDGLRLV